MKKLNLKNTESMLSRKEMRAITGGYGIYCKWSCKDGNSSASSSSTTYSAAVAYATSVCGAGNFNLICVG